MFNRRIRRAALCGSAAAGALLALGSPTVVAAQAATYSFDIPAQDVSAALIAYGRTSRQQLVFDGTTIRNKTSSPLVGEYAADDGLYKLLEGTGLRAEFAGDGAVRIVDAAAPQSGSAAGDGADGTVEALIVTAQKREEDIQDVPIAISAFTQEQLENSQVAGGPDLMTQVPNMTFTKTNFSSYSIQLRGIGTQAISATTDPAVSVAFNNTPFIRNHFFEQEFYDLQRVEVLRGPQGTLYGRNATAGVVNVISAKPTFNYEAKASGDVSNYKSTRVEGMVNVPLVEDVVALRLAGAWTKRNGYVTNEITGNPIDGRDLWSTRLSLRFTPNDNIDANLIWEHFEEDDDRLRSGKQVCFKDVVTDVGGIPVEFFQTLPDRGQQGLIGGVQATFSQGCAPSSMYSPDSFQTPNGLSLPYYLPLSVIALPAARLDPYVSTIQSRDLRVIESTVDPEYRAKNDLAELQVDIDITDGLTLTSETAYSSDLLFSMQDYNRFNTAPGAWMQPEEYNGREGLLEEGPNGGIFCDPQIGCADRLVAVDISEATSRQFSQELRLSSNFDGSFNFSLGGNYLRFDNEDKYYVFINSLSLIAGQQGNDTPYVGGVTDNAECLAIGLAPPDPGAIQDVAGCVYLDPNPIGALNDQGHNYFLSRNPYKLISYAVFGEAYYNVSDTLKVTAGLRWTVDKKEAPRIPSWVLAGATAGYPVTDIIYQEWREPTGRLAIDWKPSLSFTDQTLLYASYAHGYKAGGANPPPAGPVMYCSTCQTSNLVNAVVAKSATHPKTFEPEFVEAFELGSKNTLLDGHLTLNLAAFYYDYTGYQISQIINRSAINFNFDAEVWGIELEADWRPLENLKFGFKGGYENTRVADGMKAVDVMDRTAGNEDWIVVRPFPTFSSNCILPVDLFITPDGEVRNLGGVSGGHPGACELAYVLGFDPITAAPYVDLTQNPPPSPTPQLSSLEFYPGYEGFDPATAPNHGEGFYKDLSGNELPNAPNFTATITADYTVPLPSDWLMTLHTDLYYQSEAWWRIFNMEGYDKLKAYTNVNVAAIFTNEEAGWKVMAYVKNVMDRDSITGAFLNSDDTGLTTNVFLTEPRLYGLRVTKEWRGGPWWTGANPNHTGPYPLTVELGGQVQRHDAPNETLTPTFVDAFPAALNPVAAQNRDLDWGDGREARLTWRPAGSEWSVSAGVRYGRTNSELTRTRADEAAGPRHCAFPAPYTHFCDPTFYGGALYDPEMWQTGTNFMDATSRGREEHTVVDFIVGRDLGLGAAKGSVGLGVRYASLESTSMMMANGVPNTVIPDGWAFKYATWDRYAASMDAEREFKGTGPMLSWDAAAPLLGNDATGRLGLDWSVAGGVLFGKQKTFIEGEEKAGTFEGTYSYLAANLVTYENPVPLDVEPRSRSTSAPVLDLSLGLSYEIQRIKVGAGYRWERYFDVLDVGFEEARDADRTIDGPYFKLSVGFGG